MSDNFLFFYGGPLSQWYPSKFTILGDTYNCAEQYMMAQKAMLFGDNVAHNLIMSSTNPREQKMIGRTVKDFDVDVWNSKCRQIVYKGNLEKFRQNEDLYEHLISTGNKEIVEASPTDCIWGIGLGMNDPHKFDRTKWRGTNWLGEIIMDVRYTLTIGYIDNGK